jgi:hypothetical protein
LGRLDSRVTDRQIGVDVGSVKALSLGDDAPDPKVRGPFQATHDWAEHGASAFRYLAVRHKTPEPPKRQLGEFSYSDCLDELSWMASPWGRRLTRSPDRSPKSIVGVR